MKFRSCDFKMCDETYDPGPFKRKGSKNEKEISYACVLQCGKPCNSGDAIHGFTATKWEHLKEKSKKW